MDKTREQIINEIIKLKTSDRISVEDKKRIQKLQQELDEINDEKKNTKNL